MSRLNSSESSLFTITPDQKAKYEIQFKKICPTSDFVSGQQARELMLQSGLPASVLAHIWNLADVDADGKMDINEFSIALHLIALKMKGVELPQTLPQSLKVLVEPPPFAAFNNDSNAILSSSSHPVKSKSIVSPSNSIQQKMASLGELSGIKSTKQNAPSPTTNVMEWAIPQQSKLKYTQMFNSHDRQRTGFLTGIQARNILLESKLSQTVLAQIWNLSDVDTDGRLTSEEFVLAMHLVDKAKRNEPLPGKLPVDLIPPSYRRGSGTLSHTSSLDDTSEHNDISNISKSSFEDKRRENYEKGQAELDRRRAALQEQERRAREERERKEREENDRKEKERLEAERRRQEEIELQKQKQREQELEREEQKRRQQEVRELARKEMERQRQRELEQVRRSELLAQRTRLMEEVQKLKSRKKALAIEHEQVDKRIVENKATATATREKVVKIKSEIDGMRTKRDEALAKQSQIKAQMKSLTEKQLFVEQEKVRLAAQLKSLIGNTTNGLNPDQQLTTFVSILQAKQSQINQLRSQLERSEQEFKSKKEDIINSKQELEKLKRNYQEKRREALKFSEKLEEKRVEAEKVRDGKAQSKFASDSDVVWGQEVPTNFEWPSEDKNIKTSQSPVTVSTVKTKFRYRCVFEFQARNPDEITIKPGDIIMVDTSACSEEGWLSGELNEKIGWFPKDYAVMEEDEQRDTQAFQSITQTVSEDNGASLRQAKALYDWSSTEANHLSFYKDDLIRITQQQDSWFFGELLDNNNQTTSSGWFPESYVQIISPNSSMIKDSGTSQYYISLFAFETVEPGDLGFDVNEIIKVEKRDGDWWTGVIIDRITGQEDSNRRGIFPSNFVGPADSSQIPTSESSVSNTASASNTAAAAKTAISATPKTHQTIDRKESESIKESPKPTKKSKSKKQEIVTAVAAYSATGPEQLSLEIGQLIQVRKKAQSGWWEGELQAKGKKKQIGWFPASYVKPFGVSGNVPASGSTANLNRSTPEPITGKSANEEPEIERVIALYPFNAQREDEISFNKDDVIRVLSKMDPTWWRGHNVRSGAIGLFPSNHVQLLSNGTISKSEDNTNSIAAYNEQFYYETSNSFANYGKDQEYFYEDSFEDDSENDERNNYQDCNNFDNNFDYFDSFSDDDDDDDSNESNDSPQNIDMQNSDNNSWERQNLIYEFITTEYDYIKDLYFIIENYMNRIESSNLISRKEFELIFDQIEEIYDIHRAFFNELNQRLQISNNLHFCDLLLKYLHQMLPNYKKFFSNQIVSSDLLQTKIESDQKFEELLNKISIETKSYLTLSSYLIKPMQRITRYPLLIEKIYKFTPSDHLDYNDCFEALKFAKKFCSEVNETCRKTENYSKFHWIQKNILIPFKRVRQQIDFNSETQFLGPRTLIRSGVLIKTSSSKICIGFLFNDFFMLATPNKRGLKLNNVSNFFQCKPALESTYTLYQKPLMLNKFQITNLSNFESQLDPGSFRIFINSEKRSIIFRANSPFNCEQWLNDIYMSQQHYIDIWNKLNNPQIINIKRTSIGNLFLTLVEAIKIYTFKDCVNVQCEVAIGSNWNQISTSIFKTEIISCPKEKRRISFKSKNNYYRDSSESIMGLTSSLKGPFKVEWNNDTKFILTNLEDYLLIRCCDLNPFEPKKFLGERKIPLKDMLHESNSISGTVTKNIQLNSPLQETFVHFLNDNHYRPSLLIKYKFLLNSW